MNEIKLMVVDDDQSLMKAMSQLIRTLPYDYDAQLFLNPVKALEVIKTNPNQYDVILTDVCMPDMDGITFAKNVRTTRQDIPILVMTAFGTDEKREEAMQLGNVVFLEKPFHLAEVLGETIPNILKIKKA